MARATVAGAAANRPAALEIMTRLALEAAAAIQEIAAHDVKFSRKSDMSPVTEADRRAEAIILAGLRQAFADIPVVAEEEMSGGTVPDTSGDLFFLVDPLDGTKEFVNRRSDYTVNIALVERGVPVAGIVCAPVRREIWRGSMEPGAHSLAEKALLGDERTAKEWHTIHVRPPPARPTIVASRSHMTPRTQDYLRRFTDCECVSVGSSLKFCLVAEGAADLYPRFGPTMEWDTAAGDAVLRAAGGMTVTLDGEPLRYGTRARQGGFLNPFFIAASCDRWM